MRVTISIEGDQTYALPVVVVTEGSVDGSFGTGLAKAELKLLLRIV